MSPPRGVGKILAPIAALVALLFALMELYQALNRIKMIIDGLIFISDTYNSAMRAWSNFTTWKGEVIYQIYQPVYNAFPILQNVPGIVWNILIGLIFIYIAYKIIDRL
jgi:hypothetical protein